MKTNVLVNLLTLIMVASMARAGAELEVVPVQAGPYFPGQTVSVEVWLHNEEAFGIDLRLVGLDIQGMRERLLAGGDSITGGGTTVNHVAKFSGGVVDSMGRGVAGSRVCAGIVPGRIRRHALRGRPRLGFG